MSNEKSKSNKKWLSKLCLILFAIMFWELFHFVRRAWNPTDLNHVVTISEVEDGEITLEFDNRVESYSFGTGVDVINIDRRFAAGEVRIFSMGKETVKELLPPRRWGATLVINCEDDESVSVGWNQFGSDQLKLP